MEALSSEQKLDLAKRRAGYEKTIERLSAIAAVDLWRFEVMLVSVEQYEVLLAASVGDRAYDHSQETWRLLSIVRSAMLRLSEHLDKW